MKPERFQEVAALFREAGQRRPAERPAFLMEACGDDAELRAQVEVLLAADETHPGFFTESRLGEHAARRVVEVLAPEATEGRGHPQAIGNYRIINVLGEGGMGVVYRAEQTEPMQRTVAVKLIKLGMDSARVVARFDAERQALALMDHPNVAQVHDGGMTADGRPYFVMEYVAGIPITDYCDRERLTTHQRLDLFLQVCRGVQHAHQKGIIHRDIKPSNVLVMRQDDRPVPKIIDFGVAKATARRLTERTLFTEQGQLIGTPEYMSPEQAGTSGLDVDTRSDVYSLGVILYQLLTGTLPFEPHTLLKADHSSMVKIIREMEPPTPSSRLSTLGAEPVNRHNGATPQEIAVRRDTEFAALQRQVKGELDWIVMKCLEKDRARRYETANGLASDVQHFLCGEPVVAAPPSRLYRFRKFARRNRVALIATIIVAASLVTGLTLATYGFITAREERDQKVTALGQERQARELAEKREKETQQVSDFQAAMLSEIDVEAMGHSIKQRFREQVQAALERQYVGEFPDRRKRTAEEIEAELAAYDQRAGAAQAVDVARQVMDEFVLARAAEALEKEFTDQPLVRAQLHSALGSTYRDLGLHSAAETHFRAAMEIRQRELGDDHPDTLASIHNTGLLLRVQGRLAEAEPFLHKALDGRRRVLGNDDRNTLASINEMGLLLRGLGEYSEAEPYLREAMDGYRRVLGDNDWNTPSSIGNMGKLLDDRGEHAEAEPLIREAMEGCRRVLGDEHRTTLIWIDNMSNVLGAQGKYSEAEPYVREALDGFRRILGDEHPDTLTAMTNMGILLKAQRRLDEAEPFLREALEGCRNVLGDDNLATLDSINSFGDLLHYQGKLAEAEVYYREALDGFRRIQGDDHPDTLISMHNTACLLLDQGRPAEAQLLFAEATQAARTRLEDHPLTAVFEHHYASALRELGRLDEALDLARTAVDRYRAHPDWEPRQASRARRVLIEVLRAAGREAEALEVSWESVQAMRQRPDTTPADLASALATFAYEAITAGDATSLERAEQAARESLEIRRTVLPEDHPQVWLRYNAMSMLGEVLVGQAADPSAAIGPRIEKLREAEPLLVESGDWLTRNAERIPQQYRAERLRRALERVVELYEFWNTVVPDTGKAEQAAEWRAKLSDAEN
jgi:serine/threonine protein kinase/tetratricopeptide (TPR) repeat protein